MVYISSRWLYESVKESRLKYCTPGILLLLMPNGNTNVVKHHDTHNVVVTNAVVNMIPVIDASAT